MVDISAWNRGAACSIHATPTSGAVVLVNRCGCDPRQAVRFCAAPLVLSPADWARRLLSGSWRVRLAPRALRQCFVMRQVSQPLCLRGESGSLPLRGATGCRPWRPSRFQICGMRFDSSAPCERLGPGPRTRGWGPAEFTSAGAGENPPMTEACVRGL